MRRVMSFLRIDASDANLLRAQTAALADQIPLLYFILAVNSLAVAYTHFGTAPAFLTVAIPLVLTFVCLGRLLQWRRIKGRPIDPDVAAKRLTDMRRLGLILGIAFLVWALALARYVVPTDADSISSEGHIAFFVGITTISCSFLMRQVRSAALAIMTSVVIPFSIYLFSRQQPIETAIAVNLLLVTAAMAYAMLDGSIEFDNLVRGRAEQQRLSDELLRLANSDALTGLANRRSFFATIDRLEKDPDAAPRMTVGLFDLDAFKPVNDVYGHTMGDAVLRAFAQRMEALCAECALVARLGGDEFGVVLTHARSADDILAFGRRIGEGLAQPLEIDGVVLSLEASAGFSTALDGETRPQSLYEHADYALNHAKAQRNGEPALFAPEHATEIQRQRRIEYCLGQADLGNEPSLRFQPVYRLEGDRPIAFEALVRWRSPELGDVPPDQFIPIAEHSSLISNITLVVAAKALEAARAMPDDVEISFNISARDIASPALLLKLASIVESSHVPPSRLNIEVTETALINDFKLAQSSIRLLKQFGAKVSLDDFGAGYSSLSYVHRLPLDKIKIDRSFIQDIEDSDVSRDIVATIIAMCQRMKIGCVVEGVETRAQVDILRALGCGAAQGFFYSAPLVLEDALTLLRVDGARRTA